MTCEEAKTMVETRPLERDLKKDHQNILSIIDAIYGDYDESLISDIHGFVLGYPQLGRFTPNTEVRIYAEEYKK